MSGDQARSGPAAAAIGRVVAELSALPGVAGIVLGGSRARGTATAGSDIDLGLYYLPRERPDFDAVLAVAAKLDDRGEPTGGTYGEWGPWINGGVWLRVGGFRTDILLRDADRVREVLEDCAAGRLEVAYQPGHPHAFVSSIYAGEVFHNQPLHDPAGVLADLRRLTDPYPEALAAATVRQFGWEAGFALGTTEGAVGRGDVEYVAGCAFRAVACLVQVLHAVNRRYLLNEKGGVAAVDRMPVAPPDFAARVGAAFAALAPDAAALRNAVDRLSALREETERLAGDDHGGG
jgi:predicted nucleotidyltransferase